jgi:hypothetical protein
MNPAKLNLLEAFLDETTDEADLRSIREWIDSDVEFRNELRLAIHTRGLCAISRTEAAQAFTDRVIARCDDLQNAPLEDRVLQVLQRPGPSFWHKHRRTLAAAAALAIFASIGFGFLSHASSRHAVIAKVSERSEEGFVVRGGEKIALRKDMEIRAEDLVYVEERGTVEITYADGTNMRFDPLSYAQLKQEGAAKRVLLYSGGIQMDVAPQPKGRPLTVITEHLQAVVRGTRFDMSTSGVLSHINVREGKVAARPARQSGETMVSAGEFLAIDTKATTTRGAIGMPIFASPLLTKDSTPTLRTPISVSLGQLSKLYLVVTNGGDNNRFDHAVWIHPRLTGPAGELDLSQRPWKIAKSGWQSPVRNVGFYGEVPMVKGQPVGASILTHSTSVIEYDIPPGFDHFEAEGGLLDSGVNQPDSCSSVTFEVYSEMPTEKLNALLIRGNLY